eukprot:m51a1_g1197 putative transcription initiation factor tfiid subunit 12 (182) ;mRNA; f:445498-446320
MSAQWMNVGATGGLQSVSPQMANAMPTASPGIAMRPMMAARPGVAQYPNTSPPPKPMVPAASVQRMNIDADTEVISKKRLMEIVAQMGPAEKLDVEAEELIMEMADDFVESVVIGACAMAKHRGSTTLESRDIQLYLEKAFSLKVPGTTLPSEQVMHKRFIPTDTYRTLMATRSSVAKKKL